MTLTLSEMEVEACRRALFKYIWGMDNDRFEAELNYDDRALVDADVWGALSAQHKLGVTKFEFEAER